MEKSISGKRWKKLCISNHEDPPISSPTADVHGTCYMYADIHNEDPDEPDKAEAIGDFFATAKVNGDTDQQGTARAVKVQDGSLSYCLGVSITGPSGSITYTPSGTGTIGFNVGSYPSAGASNTVTDEGVWAEGYLNLLRGVVDVSGDIGARAYCSLDATTVLKTP